MDREEENAIIELMREAQQRARGYADFFGWAPDRVLEEVGIDECLAEALEAEEKLFFTSIRGRGRPNDPPDCEAKSIQGERIAIEVTELVDGEAIQAFKSGRVYDWVEWDRVKFLQSLAEALARKDSRFLKLKDPPYPGGYVVVVHTDEPLLDHSCVRECLKTMSSKNPSTLPVNF